MPKKVDFITVVYRLPTDPDKRSEFAATMKISGEVCGATITAMSLEDEITVMEFIEEHEDFDPAIGEEARRRTKELHEMAEASG